MKKVLSYTYKYFNNSTKRRVILIAYWLHLKKPIGDLIFPKEYVETRWLSFIDCLEIIILLAPALEMYFEDEENKQKNLEEKDKSEVITFLNKFYSNENCSTVLQIFRAFFGPFHGIEKKLQGREATIATGIEFVQTLVSRSWVLFNLN